MRRIASPKHRFLLAITLLAATVVSAGGLVSDIDRQEVVLIRGEGLDSGLAVAHRLSALGVKVIETYDTFALASLRPGQRGLIERERFVVSELPERTRTGRGTLFFDTRQGEPAIPLRLSVDRQRSPDDNFYIVQFVGPIKEVWITALRSAGAEVFDYLPSYSFVTAMQPATIQRVQRLPFVQWLGPYHPAYKIGTGLDEASEKVLRISVSVFPGRSPARAEELIHRLGGDVVDRWMQGKEHWFLAEVAAHDLVDLARLPEVAWIERAEPASLSNDIATGVVQSNNPSNRSVHLKGLHGEGQLVTLSDTGIDINHPMFQDTVAPGPTHRKIRDYYVPPGACGDNIDDAGHGTHVAGTVGGDAPVIGAYDVHDGHAFAGKIIVQDLEPPPGVLCPQLLCDQSICIPNDMGPLYQASFNSNSRIHTNSFGTVVPAPTYCNRARQTDDFMWGQSDYLILFAAGNEGPNPSTLKCEGEAKNILTVGNSGNGADSRYIYFSSSRGPAADGRIKPTVAAPGEKICSGLAAGVGTSNLCDPGYSTRTGTSMASPAVAGSAALVRQYFMEGWYPLGVYGGSASLTPSAALTKAVLVNSAEEMTGNDAYTWSYAGPDNAQGFQNALRTVKTPDSIYAARATSPLIGDAILNSGVPYTMDLYFFIPPNVQMSRMLVADDGRALVRISPPDPTGVFLEIFGSNGSRRVLVTREEVHTLQIAYDPVLQKFTANLDGIPVDSGFQFQFMGASQGRISLGTDSVVSNSIYGELIFDDVCYSSQNGSWCSTFDNFNGWTITTPPSNPGLRYPNNVQGWGRIKLDDALYFQGDQRKLLVFDERAGLSAVGQQFQYWVRVTDASQPFETTLVWTDYPATAGANPTLVNNLDLKVKDPSGVEYKGNVFAGYQPGQSATGGVADNRNVEEVVLRVQPPAGIWIITVTAANMVQAPQPFALAITGRVESPTAVGEHLTGIGTIDSGSFLNTQSSDDLREVLKEGLVGGVSRLAHVWRFENVPASPSHELNIEGKRDANSESDNFKFLWSQNLNGPYQLIPNAVLNKTIELTGGNNYPFGTPGLSGTIYIRIEDTNQTSGSSLDRVRIDHLAIR